MKHLKIANMTCEKCVERVSNCLSDMGLDYVVSLEQSTVTINGSAAQASAAIEELADIGFEAQEI